MVTCGNIAYKMTDSMHSEHKYTALLWLRIKTYDFIVPNKSAATQSVINVPPTKPIFLEQAL